MRSVKWGGIVFVLIMLATAAGADLTFYLVDNFESNSASKWFSFGSLSVKPIGNPQMKKRDLIAESCGSYILGVKGSASDWYVGGIGTDLTLDAGAYSRLQLDIYGSKYNGKIRIELYDDDNGNAQIEQDKNWQPLYDDKLAVEIPVLGKGFTRISIPFSAFVDENPGIGDDKWNPSGFSRLQMIFVAQRKSGKVDIGLDNVLLTY